ncbi:MAG: hypothetical protein RLZZ618_4200 [Pseudomonadota bacterium]|jgi:hypothetical protein
MTIFLRQALWAFLILLGATGAAHAQRGRVPLVDFVDIPVSLGSAKALSTEQVRQAVLLAAVAERWDVTPLPDGRLKLNLVKGDQYTVEVIVAYSAESYSARYVSSTNLNFLEGPPPPEFNVARARADARAAIEVQTARFAVFPEAKYAIRREATLIHPAYELSMHELLGGVRRHLSLL